MTTITLTTGASWIVPTDCRLIDSVECYSGGGNALGGSDDPGTGFGGNGGDGAGGASYAKKLAIATTPGASLPISIATQGSQAATSFNSGVCRAAPPSGRTGGQASASTGDVKFSGGDGAAGGGGGTFGHAGNGGGGGGCAGPGGNGVTGSGTSHGSGNGGLAGGGGEGGLGGSSTSFNNGQNGAVAGGGGGGASGYNSGVSGPTTGGLGGPGRIVINYTPFVPSAGGNMPMLGF